MLQGLKAGFQEHIGINLIASTAVIYWAGG